MKPRKSRLESSIQSSRLSRPSLKQSPTQKHAIALFPHGKHRAVIDKVSPEIDGGLFPIKRIIGDVIEVEADVFVDGHDEVVVMLWYRQRGEREWNEKAMTFMGNDHWQADFVAETVGEMEYTVAARADAFLTWRKGFLKLVEAKVALAELKTQLLIGAEILEDVAKRATPADSKIIKSSLRTFTKSADIDTAIKEALSESLVSYSQRYPDNDATVSYHRVLSVWVDRAIAQFSTWYEFFPRSWGEKPFEHGTFKSCETLLPHIAGMGFDVIYIPPIHPIGQSKRKGKNNAVVAQEGDVGSPWAIGSNEGGHKAIHPLLGTMRDFERFLIEARKHKLEIALDIAFQCSPDHPYVKDFPQWFKWRPDGTVQYAENPPKKYEDVLPFNFETEDWANLWYELKSIFEFWVSKGIRIFRVDNPHTKSFPFWEWCIADLKHHFPDIIFLAEAFTRPKVTYRLAKLGFSQSYTYFTWRNTKASLQTYLNELTKTELKEYFRPNFWANTPDILSEEFLHFAPASAFALRYILSATLSSNTGIYEPAFSLCINHPMIKGKEEYMDSEKYEIKSWDLSKPNIRHLISKMNAIRKENPALQQTNNVHFTSVESAPKVENEYLIAFLKSNQHNHILTVVNHHPLNIQEGWVRVPFEQLGIQHGESYLVRELFTNETFVWEKEWNFIRLNPNEYPAFIFRIERQ